MATKKRRITISVSDRLAETLERLAERDQVPVAMKVRELVRIALTIEEDDVLDVLAFSRDTRDARYVSHMKAWE